ncbi:diguanylate cyclase domain-containing protein [Pseudodesulfovibrio sediminis]|uniref:Diguanylate cyclase n=1 Tax=Pseudodesulfovibrio sediminis TaxID=2810563 RepID=A0ABM7P4B9_9BACT|nr:diguanylate cyclase [Pseudodesulfovibrio sediminis]BCS87615.1 hypothetical protein PSDVSF_08570 [Pseudodesulfovibrio sediminis]
MDKTVQKVLIVDDSKTNLALLEHMLRDIECQVVRAEGGLEALNLVRSHEFALILLDIQMPGMNGYETATKIKESESSRHIPIIFITAIYQDDDNVRQGYETGAVDYLFRPVEVNILTSKVRAFLEMNERRVLLQQEIQEHERTEKALRCAEEKYRSIFERTVEGLFQCTLDGEFIEANPAMVHILGFQSADQVVGKPGLRLSIMTDDSQWQSYQDALVKDGAVSCFEFRIERQDGEIVWCSESSHVITPDDGAPFIEGVVEDITERKTGELELQRLATIDSLTGVFNRHKFFDRLEHDLAVAKRYDSLVAVLFVDLNEFKHINDTFGHQVGDELLRMVAQRLKQRTRESDTLARIGGDEFGIILCGLEDKEGAIAVTKGLLDVVSEPFMLHGREVIVGATIGISFFPDDGKDPVTLISRADAAMYGAKKKCKMDFGTYMECGIPR